jgi:GT2 family glycosyltransferase
MSMTRHDGQTEPKVSVVIPTCDREQRLLSLIAELQKQTFQEFELIIVDQSSHPIDFKDLASLVPSGRFKVIRLEEKNRSIAKNVGIGVSRGNIVCFLDDDISLEPNLLETHVRFLHEKSLGGISCRICENGEEYISTTNILRVTFYGRSIGGRQSDVECTVESLVGGNMSVPRRILEQVGLFETAYIGTAILEEYDLSARIRALGYRLLFTNKSKVKHFPQVGGSDHIRATKPVEFFHDFNHNMALYFLRNRNWLLFPGAVAFAMIRTIVRGCQYRLGFAQTWYVFKGVFDGVKSYYRHR